MLRLGVAWVALLAACLPAALNAAVGAVAYPEWIYPTQVLDARRTAEAEYKETAETLRYGFDRPFPAPPRRVFRVDDYGALPDGQTNCTPAFYKALAAAKACRQPAEVVFGGKGRYYCLPEPALGSDHLAVLTVKGACNLLVRGQGPETVLVIGDPSLGGLWVSGSDTVMIRDFGIDYNPLPFTQGNVTELNAAAGTFVVRVHEGYPTPGAVKSAVPELAGGYRIASARDGAYKWPPINGLHVTAVKLVTGRDWCFQVDSKALQGYLLPGSEFIYVGRRYAQQGVGASDSQAFYVKRVTVYAATTGGLSLQRVDGAQLDGYAVMVPPGSNRLQSSNADGIWNQDVPGGITIKNCTISAQGDDCINLHCLALKGEWVTRASDTEIVVSMPVGAVAGDKLEVCDPHQGKIKGQVAITAVTGEPGKGGVRLKLARGLSALGYDPRTDSLYNVNWAAPSFKIVHNYFGQNRSRCLLIQARNGLIEANTLENAEGYGVVLSYCGTACPEGVIPSDVTIRGNVFRNVTGQGRATAIDIWDGSRDRNYRNLLIEDNQFINPGKLAVRAVGCDGLRIVRNSAMSEAGRRHTWNHPQHTPVDCSLYLENCANTLVDRFRLRNPGLRECGIYIGKNCDSGPAGVRVTGVEAELAPGVPAVKDAR